MLFNVDGASAETTLITDEKKLVIIHCIKRSNLKFRFLFTFDLVVEFQKNRSKCQIGLIQTCRPGPLRYQQVLLAIRGLGNRCVCQLGCHQTTKSLLE